MEFGARLKKVREDAKLTQEELARVSRLSVFTISRLETATQGPSLATMRKLARGLRVSVKDLL